MDLIIHAVANKGQKRTLLVTHKSTGEEWTVNTRTEWYGHHSKKAGGELAKLNEGRDSIWLAEEFTYLDIVTPEPIENCLHTAKVYLDRILKLGGTDKFKLYMGKGECWRVEHSTLLGYKQQRRVEKEDRPTVPVVYKQDVMDYYARNGKYQAEYVEYYEVDEMLVMDCFRRKDRFAIAQEKDAYYCPFLFLDTTKPELGIQDCNQFGKLWLDGQGKKEKVRGIGRLWMYQLICSSDSADNYYANCFSELTWGEKSSYKLLKDCQSDKEAFQVMLDIYKHLYPLPREVVGWKGDTILIDYWYVLQEVWDMAMMLRFPGDKVDVKDLFTRSGVQY